jgi:hypothetical protein
MNTGEASISGPAVDEGELVRVLNSAPVEDGRIVETLDDPRMIALRDDLHAVIRGQAAADVLAGYLAGVTQAPRLEADGVRWELQGPASALPYAGIVLEWSRVERERPGRLRACANDECNKFLIDHSKPNSARWCSMASCGNRMKARRHHARQIDSGAASIA